MNPTKQILITICLLLQSILCFSQSEQWVNCLSHRQVNDLIEHDGNIYLATTGGLLIYNATNESIVKLNRANSDIPSNYIIEIEHDKDSTLWLMTDIGLCSYKGGIWQEYLDLSGVLTLDEEGQINVATKSAFYYWNDNDFQMLDSYPDLTNLQVHDLIIDKLNGNIWLSAAAAFAPAQIFRYADNSWSDSGLSTFSYELLDMAFDSENQLWCISDNELYKFEAEWVQKSDLIDQENNYYFTGVGSDDSANIYVSYTHPNITSDNFLYKIDQDEIVHKYEIPVEDSNIRFSPTFLKSSTDNSSIYLGTINNACLTYQAGMWSTLPIETSPFKTNYMNVVKTDHHGIYLKTVPYSYYGNHQFFNYKDNEWSDLSEIYPFKDAYQFRFDISEGNEQDLWINLNDSLYFKEDTDWIYASKPDINQDIQESNSQIYFDHEGRQWLLNKEKNYILYESASGWKVFNEDDYELINTNYLSIFNHPISDELWISGYKGIAIYNYLSNEWRFVSFSELGLLKSYVALHIDSNQDIIATQGQSIIRINEGVIIDTIASLSAAPELESFSSTLIEEDTIWLGMKGAVVKYYDNAFELFDRTNSGIVNGHINSIIRDDNGNLWFSGTTGGLAIYNQNGVTEDFEIKIISNTVICKAHSFNFDLFPNPFDSDFSISLPDDILSAELNIYNQFGQLMYSKAQVIQNENIRLADISTGVYYVEIIDSRSKEKSMRKCIKK